nr:SapC family protein [uncultured Desulfuromonas sp.]
MPEIYPITVERYGKKHLLPISSWEFVAQQNLAPLVPAEFSEAAHCFPIVFVEKEQKVTVCGLLGLKPGKNLLLDAANKWLVAYIPAIFRRYPFLMAPVENKPDEFALCIDEASGLIADEGGAALFDDGQQTEFLKKAMRFVSEFQKQLPSAEMFCHLLKEFDLLVPWQISMQEQDKKVNLGGILRVDEDRLQTLSDEDFMTLRNKGVLPLIYAHLFSLSTLRVLLNKFESSLLSKVDSSTGTSGLPESFSF